MYHGGGPTRWVRQLPELSGGPIDPHVLARQGLARLRTLLGAYLPGMGCPTIRLRGWLRTSLPVAALEAERFFALGWLAWLEGDFPAARALFDQAVVRAKALPAGAPEPGPEPAPLEGPVLLARSAYWQARVGLLLGKADALADYEAHLRTLGGSPQATAWFVDLLWRAGRVERAEQVWKPVRSNRKVMGCDEGPLLEARVLLRRGECAPAERVLLEASPGGCVAFVERLLLLAWARVGLRQPDRAREALGQAVQGLYPSASLRAWEELLEVRAGNLPLAFSPEGLPPGWSDLVRGQQARAQGDGPAAVEACRAALDCQPAAPFARYALAALGQGDFAAVLAGQPGLFLALRCRVRQVLERFRLRQASPAEMLDALQQGGTVGYTLPFADHLTDLARRLQRPPDAPLLRDPAPGEGPAARNLGRAALEQVVRHLPPTKVAEVLLSWAEQGAFREEAGLREDLGRQLLRLACTVPVADLPGDVLQAARALLPGDPLALLAQAVKAGEPAGSAVDLPAARLWDSVCALANGPVGDDWRAGVAALEKEARLRHLARALLIQEAARRGAGARVAELLEDLDVWRGFRSGPPELILQAVQAVAAAQPGQPTWKRVLPRWLGVWQGHDLGRGGQTLAALAGLAVNPSGEAPPGVDPTSWFLHQSARLTGRDDRAALAFLERALAQKPGLEGVPGGEAALAALPELRHRADAAALATALVEAGLPAPAPDLLADLVDALAAWGPGSAVLEKARQGAGAGQLLAELAEQPDLPARVAHHLALLHTRAAGELQRQDRPDEELLALRRAWRCWLTVLCHSDPPISGKARGLLLDHLLAGHRSRINSLLARDRLDQARQVHALVRGLPDLVLPRAEEAELASDLASRVAGFRDQLATEYLLSTREAMRAGAVPEGWRADYPRGLALLTRFLSLERDNVRLLTSLLEVCNDWFLDLYNSGDARGLVEQVERYTPLALQLGRLLEARPGEVAARAALAEFTKVRGVVARDRATKVALYREALRLDPGHTNARDLLLDLGEAVDPPGAAVPEEGPIPPPRPGKASPENPPPSNPPE